LRIVGLKCRTPLAPDHDEKMRQWLASPHAPYAGRPVPRPAQNWRDDLFAYSIFLERRLVEGGEIEILEHRLILPGVFLREGLAPKMN
jgi:hypothetical protein